MSSRRKRARKSPKKHILPFSFTLIVSILFGVLALAAAGMFVMVQSWLVDLPAASSISSFNQEQKTQIVALDGTTLLGELYWRDRIPVTSDRVSPYVFESLVSIEDERFYEHNGVDYYGIVRAIVVDLTTNYTQGASTITMQLVRQTLLQSEANDMTIRRKVREAVLALQVEEIFSKEEILMMYLNGINFGDGCWGIESAARHYFNKPAADLTLPEAALLCGVPQSPEYNNPVAYPENALRRRNIVLDTMYKNGYINEEEWAEARASEVVLNVQKRTVNGIYQAPWATSYTIHELFNKLDQSLIMTGGLTVYTSISMPYTWWAEEACAQAEVEIDNIKPGFEVSLTCVEPSTGYIMCMRGGRNFDEDQFNTCWQMRRQAGSSFKTFGLVAAIENNYSPYAKVSTDSPLQLGDWKVENYSGRDMGEMTLAQATWFSSNTAYARVVRTIGPDAVVNVAARMGITSKLEPVRSAVLGSNGVCTMEMASAFGTLANNGRRNTPTTIIRIEDKDGNIVYQHTAEQEQVITPEVAYAAVDVLRGVVRTSGATGTRAYISGRDIAGKTGTANNWTDAWFVGFTPQLSTAVWVGNRSVPTRLDYNEGGVRSAPVWRYFMVRALDDKPNQDFTWAPAPYYRPNGDFRTKEERETDEKKKTDSDGDGFSDWEEEQAKTDPHNPNDYPGLAEEIIRLKNTDSDGDGFSDYDEIQAGTDPYNPLSYPGSTPPGSPPIVVPPFGYTPPSNPGGSGGNHGP